MNTEELDKQLRKFEEFQEHHTPKTAAELDALLYELNGLASQVRQLPGGDQHATTAKVDELRRQYTDWYNAAVEREQGSAGTATKPELR